MLKMAEFPVMVASHFQARKIECSRDYYAALVELNCCLGAQNRKL